MPGELIRICADKGQEPPKKPARVCQCRKHAICTSCLFPTPPQPAAPAAVAA